ncbi:MAG: hypothetical protein ACI8W8_003069 [Rhodothermales bacterium]|jgi:hypothetical protein
MQSQLAAISQPIRPIAAQCRGFAQACPAVQGPGRGPKKVKVQECACSDKGYTKANCRGADNTKRTTSAPWQYCPLCDACPEANERNNTGGKDSPQRFAQTGCGVLNWRSFRQSSRQAPESGDLAWVLSPEIHQKTGIWEPFLIVNHARSS